MKVMLDDGAYMPERAHDLDAGLDLRTPVNIQIAAASGRTERKGTCGLGRR